MTKIYFTTRARCVDGNVNKELKILRSFLFNKGDELAKKFDDLIECLINQYNLFLEDKNNNPNILDALNSILNIALAISMNILSDEFIEQKLKAILNDHYKDLCEEELELATEKDSSSWLSSIYNSFKSFVAESFDQTNIDEYNSIEYDNLMGCSFEETILMKNINYDTY